MNRRILVAALVVGLAATAASPALAKHKPVVKKSYQAGPATPDPTNNNIQGVCNGVTPTSRHSQAFTAPEPGTLKVTLKNTLDWAVSIRDSKGKEITSSDGSGPTDKEIGTAKLKKAGKYTIVTCNFAGEPAITVDYTFTYAK